MLNASVVTSCDTGGHRRFRSKENDKWGYCTHDGIIVQAARFEKSEHFNTAMQTYNVVEGGEERYYDPDWSNFWTPEAYAAFRAF